MSCCDSIRSAGTGRNVQLFQDRKLGPGKALDIWVTARERELHRGEGHAILTAERLA